MEHALNQTAHQRAWQDTELFRKSGLSFWAFGVVGVAVFGVAGALVGFWLTPPNSSAFWRNAWTTIGGGLGVVTGFVTVFLAIYLWNLFRAPYRQRNEARDLLLAKPKPIPIPNHDTLFKAIAEARMATIEVAENIENLKLKKKGNFIFQDANMWDRLDRIQRRFGQACESLERETFVAGTVFEPILKPLLAYMRGAAELDSSTVSDYKIELEEMVMITRNRIEELVG